MKPDTDISSAPLARIVCAAIRHPLTKEVLAGARHYDPIMRGILKHLTDHGDTRDVWYAAEQGFITNIRGEFVDRQQAWKIAEAAGQIRQVTGSVGTLYSEDLY